MVVSRQADAPVSSASPFKNALAIARTEGGEETNPLWTSEVGNASFSGALRTSLEQNDLLAANQTSSRFDLFAVLASMTQPLFGLDLRVESSVIYRVIEKKTQMTWFDDAVHASYTATFGDSPLAVQRLRLANEGSIRENVKEFIRRLAETQPPTSSQPVPLSSEERLRNLQKLLDDKLINQEEFNRKKHQILKDL